MKKHLLIICICIVLFIPISSAVDVNTDVDDEARENYEIEPLDNYEEIITFIFAWGEEGSIDVDESGTGIFRHVEIWADESIEIKGLRRFLIFPIPFIDDTKHLIAPHCFIWFHGPYLVGYDHLFAIAIGDIEYS